MVVARKHHQREELFDSSRDREYLYAHDVPTLCACCNASLTQEKTGAESVIGTTSAVQQVEEECGVPVVSVVGMSHLTEYMASKENATPGANAQVDV
ncbi:unnamed protein product [Ectocarpus sp. CCAP 1310/34]|nr:unnamed protein product [Ectocarpus sp. CCAP 1310/34]